MRVAVQGSARWKLLGQLGGAAGKPDLVARKGDESKTGCPNRGLHVWTTGENTPSAALGE